MHIPSPLISDAVEEMSKLPGIGKKTALRLVLHLLKKPQQNTFMLSESLVNLREKIRYCRICHNISDEDTCSICQNSTRDETVICIVNDFPDIFTIENTHQYQGLYHVLGGIITPVSGVGPEDLSINDLIKRIKNAESPIQEVIFALSSTMEGDTTVYYIAKLLENFPIKITSLARGIPVGEELEYTDEVTLGRSIQSRRHLN